MPCYSGPNPVTDPKDRMIIWKWAKENGIDQGLPFAKIHDAINTHFFGGMARSEWIDDILSGRKTPFRTLANDVWRAQYNRRMITQQAQAQMKVYARSPLVNIAGRLWAIPRVFEVLGHGFSFPVTHGGDLALRPESWGVFMRGVLNSWTKSWSPVAAEKVMATMERHPLYDLALRSVLDVGPKAHITNLVRATGKGSLSERSFGILQVMRFELWRNEMEKYVTPDMNQETALDIGRNLAEWANHATGSAKGPISNLGGAVLFGPKLTQSKLNRMFVDPVKTINTFSNWETATPGEKAVAWTRLKGSTQYAASAIGFLAANQGFLWATGSHQKINFTDPTKSDFLAFKVGGLEFSLPGMHSEIRTLGRLLATTYMSEKALRGESRQAKQGELLGNYLLGKVSPAISLGKELVTGEDFLGRPLPWKREKSTPTKPRYRLDEYLLTRGPLPLQGPIQYVYDQLRKQGASAQDSTGIIKGLIVTGLPLTVMGATGLHVNPDYALAKEGTLAPKLTRTRTH
jgi:hypothetical protein